MMERLTKPTIGCFKYDLKDHKHEIGEFNTYEAFYNYSVAAMRLGAYEDTGLTPKEIAKLQAENTALKAKLAAAMEDIKEMLYRSTDCVFCKEPKGSCGAAQCRVKAQWRGLEAQDEHW